MSDPRKAAMAAALSLAATLLATTTTVAAGPPAEPDDTTLRDEIVVSAEPLEAPAGTVGSSVSVLLGEELERRNAVTVLDALRSLPGLEIVQGGSLGRSANVRVRGGDAQHTLVLVDGVRVNSVTLGEYDLSNLMADGIERIEVVRGPQAIYGSEAVAGVVSIVTRRPTDGFSARGRAEIGNEGFSRLGAGLALGGARGSGSVDLSDTRLDDLSQRSAALGFTEPDPYDNQTLAGRLGWQVADEGRLDLTLRGSQGTTELDGFFGEDLNLEQETAELQAALRWQQQLLPRWQQTVALRLNDNDLLGVDPDTPANRFDIRTRSREVQLRADLELAPERRGGAAPLSLGYGVEQREAQNLGDFGFDQRVYLRSGFAHQRFSVVDRVHVTAAVRHDDHTTFGDETTWRATGSFELGARSRLHAGLGTGFRAPDFNELFFPFSGDPTLRPETSRGWDVGIEQRLLRDRLALDLTWFDLEFDDLIVFDLGTFVFRNLAVASSRGVEAQARWRFLGDRGALAASHTWNDTEDEATGAPLDRRPEHRTVVGLDLAPTERWSGRLQLLSVRDRFEAGAPLDDYERVDLTVSARATSWLFPYLRVQNALDEDYEEVPGFTTPGRLWAVGVKIRR